MASNVYWRILITATIGASANTAATVKYVNSDGLGGRTATISNGGLAASQVLGTLCPFSLQAGDRGVSSIDSITLSTTLTSGQFSLVKFRTLATIPNPIINAGGTINRANTDPTGIRIYNGSCLLWVYVASATTANTMGGTITITEK